MPIPNYSNPLALAGPGASGFGAPGYGAINFGAGSPMGTSSGAGTHGTPAALPVAPIAPTLPDYSNISQIINQINATQQAAQHQANLGRIPGAEGLEAQSSQNIAGLLNPPTQFAEIDVPSAARAVASGTVGSPFAGVTGLQLSENERLRRQAAGQQQLSAAYARNPSAPIANAQALYEQIQQQLFAAQEAARNRDFQGQQAALNRANQLSIAALGRSIHQPTGTSGRFGPRLPTDYQTNIPGETPHPNPYGVTNISGVENWDTLTPQQQAEYNAAIGQNPYFGLPDWMNPYSGDEIPPDAFDLGPNPVVAPGVAPEEPQTFGDYNAEDYYSYA